MSRRYLAALSAALFIGTSASGALLNLQLSPSPDITAGFINVNYNAGSQTFSASGWGLSLFDGIDNLDFDKFGPFEITAQVDSAGNASGGSFAVHGQVAGYGPSLLTGDLVNFGFDPSGVSGIFEFVFSVTGGDLAIPEYYGGNTFGVIFSVPSSFTGSWSINFSGSGGVADVAPLLPGPGGIALMAAAALIAPGRRRAC